MEYFIPLIALVVKVALPLWLIVWAARKLSRIEQAQRDILYTQRNILQRITALEQRPQTGPGPAP